MLYTYKSIKNILDFYTLLIFKFFLLIIKNNVIFYILVVMLVCLLWSLEHADNFLFNGGLWSEDYSTLNATGGSSSNNPNPNPRPNPSSGYESGPGPGSNSGPNPGFWDSILNPDLKDTDRLANRFESFKGHYIKRSGILFGNYTAYNQPTGYYDADLSRVARYIKLHHPTLFPSNPHVSIITDQLINNIRVINENIPQNYR